MHFSTSEIIFGSYYDLCCFSVLVKTFSYSAYCLSTFLLCTYNDSINKIQLFPIRVQRIMHDLWVLEHGIASKIQGNETVEVAQFQQ